jgi:Spy/CpxP family protein refolding chaperone
MMKNLAVLLFAVAVTAAPSAWSQGNAADATDLQALRAAVKADKKAYVASVLALTPAEAKKFWPAYDAYQRALDMTGREKNMTIIEVVGQDKPVSDLYAKQIAKEIMLADDTEAKARKTLYNRVMKALPPKKAVRYLQLEGKIRAAQAYEVAETIPLIR